MVPVHLLFFSDAGSPVLYAPRPLNVLLSRILFCFVCLLLKGKGSCISERIRVPCKRKLYLALLAMESGYCVQSVLMWLSS